MIRNKDKRKFLLSTGIIIILAIGVISLFFVHLYSTNLKLNKTEMIITKDMNVYECEQNCLFIFDGDNSTESLHVMNKQNGWISINEEYLNEAQIKKCCKQNVE
jgi:hypothetical protein